MSRGRDTIMVDNRVYFSVDAWKHVWLNRGMPNGSSHRLIRDREVINRVRAAVKQQHEERAATDYAVKGWEQS